MNWGNLGKELVISRLVVVVNDEKVRGSYKMWQRRRAGRKPLVHLKSKDEGRMILRNFAPPPSPHPSFLNQKSIAQRLNWST